MPLTIEQQRAIAIAQAKRKRAEAEAKPSLRAETDAIIEEAAAAIPGGYEAFIAKPPNAERMKAMGYVPDPLAPASTGGFSKPRAQPQQVVGPLTGDTSQPNLFTDVMRGLEAPIAGLTGGGLEGWAKTTTRDPVRGAVEAVDFISPVDDLGRAYQGIKQAGAGLIDGDMAKAAEGGQQALIDGSYAAMQMLPGSMTLRGVTGPVRSAPTTLAGAERAAVQATQAPSVRKGPPAPVAPVEPPKPFSAPPEPKASGFLQSNADRIATGAVGGFLGGAGDALASSGGDGGGPDIINPVTGAAAGMFLPRFLARGYRAAGGALRGGGFNEAVARRAVRNALAPAGRSADEIAAANRAQFGDKPAPLAGLTQNAQNMSVGLSRQPGQAAEMASEQAQDLMRTRSGRLFSDVEATTKINPATVTADIDAAIKKASEEISPAYEKLFAENAGVNSERLMQLADDPVVGPYVRRAIQASESLQTTAGQAPSNARTWDLVKRGLDRTIESQKRSAGQAPYELEMARGAIKEELDALMPDYKAVRDGADAPRMRAARKEGAKVAGGGLSVEKVRGIASGLTGKPLTALQMGTVEKIVLDIEKGRGLDGLSSERMRQVFGAVFDEKTADELTARLRADQTILKNAQRRDPDFGAVTSQAGMADRGLGAAAADAFRAVRNPLEAGLAMLSRSGAYTREQRDRIAQMLYGGATDENLARIYSGPKKSRRGPPTTPPAPPTGGGTGPASAPMGPPPAKMGFGGKSLPMDEPSRIQRAREQGFDVDTPLYHGTDKSFDEFSANPRNRNDTGHYGKGTYFSTQPGEANYFAEWSPGADAPSPTARVIKAYARGKLFDVTDGGDVTQIVPDFLESVKGLKGIPKQIEELSKLWDDAVAKVNVEQIRVQMDPYSRRMNHSIPDEMIDADGVATVWTDADSAAAIYYPSKKDAVADLAYRQLSRDGVRFPMTVAAAIQRNIGADEFSKLLKQNGYDGVRAGDEVVIFDPANIRSVDAAFDPSETQSSKLLAGVRGQPEAIGAGLGTVFAPDADGDGEVSFGERAGAAITGGVMGRGARAIGNRLRAPSVQKGPPRGRTPDQAGLGPKPQGTKGPPKKAEEVALIAALKKARTQETATRKRTVMANNRDELRRPSEEAVMQAERDLLEYRDRQFRQAANTARWKDRGAAVAGVGKKAAVATGNQIKKTMMKDDAELLKTYGIAVGGIAGIALGARALAGPDDGTDKKKEVLPPTDKRYFVEMKLKKNPEMLGPVQKALAELGMLDPNDADTKWGSKTKDALAAYLSRKPDRLPDLPLQDYEVPALLAEAYGGYKDEKGKWFYESGDPIVYPPKRDDTYLPARPLRPDEARRMQYEKRTEAQRKN